ncbi:MAG: prepilin-type N-terminal cleavage/methylation domain-containing protein [Deltaproteobacteria bacterium]|nr:prepilin-type N-terminal cleavage/methylation domain-containing protein [Deltaproteobacteria bacterium]MBW2650370.1 prepilin-type N-terminal cleavage/methylation domain-containing protein [Deltaproteobacteria bacterium]
MEHLKRKSKKALHTSQESDRGFTLIELLIAMAVGLVLLGAMYGVFTMHSKTLGTQEQIAEMQQNVRAGMDMMIRDIRMAGYDPEGTASAGIVSVSSDKIYITMDLNGDGALDDSGEHLVYDIYDNKLGRTSGTSSNVNDTGVAPYHQPVAENIVALAFVHSTANNTVTITLRGRTADIDPDYTDPTYSDHYRRYTLQTTVVPRNLSPS